jgi:predicted RND superfamily exporter protein
VLLLSPVPMVRGFGALLIAGIAVALACALTLGTAALSAAARRRTRPRGGGAGEAAGAALRGARELLTANALARRVRAGGRAAGRAALRAAVARPGRVVGVALAVALVGWGLDTQASVESDITKLVPQDRSVRDLQTLQRATGVGGEVDVLVSGPRVTDPKVVAWMTRYQRGLLDRFGFSERRGCGQAELCPAFSLPDLFQGAGATNAARIDALLDAVPPYFSEGVITRDRRTATLAFGLRLAPLERQSEVLREMRRRLHPPAGVTAQLAGLPVLAAEANDAISAPWRRLAAVLAGLAAVALVLLVALRRPRRALVPLVPIALAGGWSALVLFALRIPLNPMSVVLGALVVAITTEFSVLLSERYAAEREAGRAVAEALERTYRSTGAAVLASGCTAIAGFAVLIVSDVRMLRDFGFVTVVDLAVALAGVMVVLPAVLVLAERRGARVRSGLRRRARAGAA